MSSMAKIFVVVNLILVVAVFGSAATLLGAQDDYKKALESATASAKKAQEELNDEVVRLRNERNAFSTKASDAVSRANSADARAEELNTTLANAKQMNESLVAAKEKGDATMASLTEVNEKYRALVEKLTGDARTATEEKLAKQKQFENEAQAHASARSQISDLNEQIEQMKARVGDLEKELRNAQFFLKEYEGRFGKLRPSEGAPGRVNAVRGNLVSLSVGSEDGVQVGDEYRIRRGGTFVGTMRITSVQKGLAVGQFDTKFVGPGQAPQVGDVAEPTNK